MEQYRRDRLRAGKRSARLSAALARRGAQAVVNRGRSPVGDAWVWIVIGVDTSFLAGLAVEGHSSHHACWELFDGEIVGKPASMVITAQVLAEFCHVITRLTSVV
jgi:hypothetical protein